MDRTNHDDRTAQQATRDAERAAAQRAAARGQPDIPGLFDPANRDLRKPTEDAKVNPG